VPEAKARRSSAIAHAKRRGDIILERLVRARRAGLDRIAAIADGRKHVLVDHDQRGRVFGDVAAVGDHDRHGLADIADSSQARQCW